MSNKKYVRFIALVIFSMVSLIVLVSLLLLTDGFNRLHSSFNSILPVPGSAQETVDNGITGNNTSSNNDNNFTDNSDSNDTTITVTIDSPADDSAVIPGMVRINGSFALENNNTMINLVELTVDKDVDGYIPAVYNFSENPLVWYGSVQLANMGNHSITVRITDSEGKQYWNSIEVKVPYSIDEFGIKKIYDSSSGGREWFINMADPDNDDNFRISTFTGNRIEKNEDGSWYVSELTKMKFNGVRLEILSSDNEPYWHNVEMTAYVKLRNFTFIDQSFDWYSRSGFHTSKNPCDGTAYHQKISYNGSISFEKELWHTGGYSDTQERELNVIEPLQGRWIGFKAVIYNTDNDKEVKMQVWIDNDANNTWVKLNENVDFGSWPASDSNSFFTEDCTDASGSPLEIDEVITWPRPIVALRADNASFDFKNLSVREITAPEN